MSRPAAAKDRQGWHICGPWYGAHPAPGGYIGVTAKGCKRRRSGHQHVYFSSWFYAMRGTRFIQHQPAQPTP